VENYYSLLGVNQNSSGDEIKKAFRDLAKKNHPDVAGKINEGRMRKLLTAYEVLSDPRRREQYDISYARFVKQKDFDYRSFLKEKKDDPFSQAKLIFYYFLHLEDDDAIEVWETNGALDFQLEKYLDREDWMDCAFILAEELEKRNRIFESFCLLTSIVREERRKPYFKHFMEDIEIFLKELIRLKLRHAVDDETYVNCLEEMLTLGFSSKDDARWMRSIAETLLKMGEFSGAQLVFKDALKKDPALPNAAALKRKLKVQ
jgi:tetratricopeptide (TPR) repeat protein